MGKVTLQKPTGSEFRGLLMNWPKSQVTHEIQAINDFKFHHVLLTWLVLQVSNRESIASQVVKTTSYKFFIKLSRIALILNPTKIQGND